MGRCQAGRVHRQNNLLHQPLVRLQSVPTDEVLHRRPAEPQHLVPLGATVDHVVRIPHSAEEDRHGLRHHAEQGGDHCGVRSQLRVGAEVRWDPPDHLHLPQHDRAMGPQEPPGQQSGHQHRPHQRAGR